MSLASLLTAAASLTDVIRIRMLEAAELEAPVPNKTIYVSDDDMPLYRRAQDLARGNLSAAISAALRRYVEMEEGRNEGYDEITVTVGTGTGRKVRFSGLLLGEWAHTTSSRVEKIRVYRTRTGKFAVHTERSPEWTSPDGDKWSTGWRGWIGNWSPSQEWNFTSGEATLKVADSIEAVRDLVPSELYDVVAAMAAQPPVEDLDI
jgi:EXLDI family protein